MLSTFKEAWASLTPGGRMWVAIVLGLAVCGLIALAMFMGYKLDWIPGLLGAK